MTTSFDNIAVIGAGAWGTALAQVFACAGRNVRLYARSAHLAGHVNDKRENLLYLPGIPLHAALRATSDRAEAAAGADIVVLAAPAQFLRQTLKEFLPFLPPRAVLVNSAKGMEISTGRLPAAVAAEEAPGHPYAALSGPSLAQETARGLPTAVVLATSAPEAEALLWAGALRGAAFRPYLSPDPVGAEVGGALKNVVAIACGIVAGRALGQNARAAVMTRGMAEIRRFGLAMGARADTFLGLSGLGDLTLTCNAESSRNFSLGRELGEGRALADILSARRGVAEGVATARALAAHAAAREVDMPICHAVDHILHGGGDIGEIISGLLSRALRSEAG